jgi:hypothetical protein
VLADKVTRREAKSASVRALAAGLDASMRLDTWVFWHDQACVWRQCLIAWSIRGTSSRKVTQTSS